MFGYDPCSENLKYAVVNYTCYLENSMFISMIENKYTNTTLNAFYDEFVVSFDILPKDKTTGDIIIFHNENENMLNLDIFENIIHITIFNNWCDVKLTPITWSSIIISQYFINGNNAYNITISVNGIVQYSNINTQPTVFTNVIFYTFYGCYSYPQCKVGSIGNLSVYSKTQVIWTQWTDWSQCNGSCVMTRSRNCINNQLLNCIGKNTEINSCNNIYQAYWSEWNEWSGCNAQGLTTRTRNCSNCQPSVCVGNSTEIKICTVSSIESFIMENETLLSKGNLVATISSLRKEYSVSFEIQQTSISNGWGSVIHLTIGNNSGSYGDRTPYVFFAQDKSGALYISSAVCSNSNYIYKTSPLRLGTWSSVRISQQLVGRKYIYSIDLNSTTVFQIENNDTRDFSNVKVYVSSPWYEPQPGFIKNLRITNKNLAFWSEWSEWSCCNSSGLTTRTRNCNITQPFVCEGNSTETKTCKISLIGVEINVEKNQQQYELYNASVKVFTCNNVQMFLDFGDGTTVTNIKNINASTEKGYTYTIFHSYSVCQQFTISASIFKTDGYNISALFSNSTNVKVVCLLSPLKINKIPPESLNGYIQLSLNKNITLDIYQETGSNMIYSIDWGDGNSTINNQTLNFSPVSFQVQYMYKSINNYTISVACRNYLQVLTPIFIHIQVTNCSMPEVFFYYGTVYNPMTIVKSVGRDLTAFVESVSSLCKNETFTFEWNLTTFDLKPIVAQQKGILYQQKVTYSIAKNALKFGFYILSLQCSYGNVSAIYNAYLNVIFSPLYMEIDNGVFVSVAYTKKIGNKSFYQNFKVSALSSYDFDDPAIGVQNISFKWRCKVASNFSDAKAAMDNFTVMNLTFLSDSCFNETWIEIPSFFSEIIFNTSQFLEEISYHIEVCGTKYAGKDVYSNNLNKTNCYFQEVLISGSVPTVTLKCISNCDTKLNFKERMIYSFVCEDCGYRRLDANWTIEDDTGNFPSELSIENATSTGFLIPSLVINKDILLASKNYTFILVVGYANSAKKAKIKFKKSTCSQPTPGYCAINPAEGFALVTKFKLFCNGWRDSDGLLSYAFYYDNGQLQKMKISSVTSMDYPILNAGTTDQPSLINFVMGPGDENNDYQIRIFIKVINKYQAYTECNLYIKVYPNNKPAIIKDLLTDINLNDTQSIANLVQAVSNSINKNSASQYNITPTTANDLFITADDNTLKQLKRRELSGLQELRTQLIGLINNTSFDDLNSFKLISDALVVTSQNPLEIVPYAQSQAASIVDRLSRLLTKKNLKGFGAEKFDTMSQSFVNSISNLLQPAVPTSSLNLQDERFVPILIKSMENYFIAAQSFKVPGENKTVGATEKFDFLLKKDIFIDLSSSFIGSPDGGFSLPDSKDLFNDSLHDSQISIHNVRMKDLVFTWDNNRSQNILTETQSLFFSDSNGHPIKVSNSSQPINITIKNKPETMNGVNISLSMPNDAYHVTLPIASDCKMLLKLVFKNDENNITNLIVYIQYGKVATKLDYDIMLNISINHGVVMTKNYNVTNTVVLNSNNNINKESTRILQRNQDGFLLTDGTIILWNFKNSTYSLFNKSELHLMFMYSGPMPAKISLQNSYNFDDTEYPGKFEYELNSFCVECNYWKEDANRWMSDGCQLDVYYTSFWMTKCICNHLTTFGGFFVAPNPLPRLSIAKLKSGYVLIIVVIIVISLWLLGLLFTRRMDRKDISKIGVCPLADNRDEDTHLYQIVVNTGTRRNAGTKSNIFINVSGNINESGVRRLKDPERECFQRSGCDIFIMTTKSTLGDLDFIWVWHDNSGGGWYIKNIIIIDLQTGKKFVFNGHCWIAVDHGSCKLDTVIPVASIEESSSFIYAFKNKAQHKLHDEHLWFSIFFRSPQSNFTRCQRLSVGVSLILTSMMVNTMFYQRLPPVDPVLENKVSSFVITWTQVFVILISTCIKLPVNFILVKLFYSIKQFPKDDSPSCSSCDTNNTIRKESYSCVHLPANNNLRSNSRQLNISNKKIKLCIAWCICAGNIFACGFIVLLYGMEFGNKKSLNWLASILIDFMKGILVLEPLKIFILVAIMILVAKKIDDEKENTEFEKQGKRLAFDENWLHKPKDELSIIDSDFITVQPPDYSTVRTMRELVLKQQKMHSIVIELILYIFYACLVFLIGFFSRDNVIFYQTRNVQELFNLKLRLPANPNIPIFYVKVFNQIQSSQDFWHWLEGFFLPQVFPEPWYNLSDFYANTDKKTFPGKLFLNDLTSKIVNGIRIRQVRVKPNSCVKADSIADFIGINCLSPYKTTFEETRGFDLNWSIPKQYNSTINSLTMPWRYQTWQELDGYPYTANLDTYYGGGYVIELFSKWKNQILLNQWKKLRWIDRQTRAIIIEFALFNAATNYFNMVTMALEFPASGGFVPSFSVLTFNLYASVTGSQAMLGSHIIFILITILLTVRESRFIYRAGCKYFIKFWNLAEVAMILSSVTAAALFFYKDYLAKMLLQRLPDKKPQVFINFQFASYCDMTYLNIVSLIVFFVTLKFIKLLQFNHHVSMITYTLKTAWYPLSMFGIVFFIVLCSFVTFSNIVFGVLMVEYKTYFEALVSTVSLLLGKFSFNQYKIANIVLGPIFFFGFNVIEIWFIMNIFISILNDAFTMVRANPEYQNNDYEVVEYIMEQLKGWFEIGQKKKQTENKTLRIQPETKLYPISKVIQVAEYDGEHLRKFDEGGLTEYNEKRFEVIFEKKCDKRQTVDFIGKEEDKDLYSIESKNTPFDYLFSKFDYLLNESNLDNEISETIDQLFDKDLFKKFINCMIVVHKNIQRDKVKQINEVIIMDIEEDVF